MSDAELDFQKIHETFRPKIQRYLARLVGDHEAEDLTQEVLVKVNNALKNFRGESQLSTWIYRIATNVALDKLRVRSLKQRAQKSLLNITPDADGLAKDTWTEAKIPSAEEELVRQEMNECIRDFVENLPENYRTVLVLSELEGLANREISEVLGITLDAVKIRLHRARAELKKELESHCTFYRDGRNELACDLKTVFSEFRNRY